MSTPAGARLRAATRADLLGLPVEVAPRLLGGTLTTVVDGETVRVPEGATILDACRKLEIDTPTLCFDEPLRPANVCRVCVVELEGSRVLVPSCSRTAETGMKVRTDSERVRVSRKLVMELLASSVDLSTTPAAPGYLERYDAAIPGPRIVAWALAVGGLGLIFVGAVVLWDRRR